MGLIVKFSSHRSDAFTFSLAQRWGIKSDATVSAATVRVVAAAAMAFARWSKNIVFDGNLLPCDFRPHSYANFDKIYQIVFNI